jgi:cytochrome c-type biogenesis protein CcmH/NrfG
VAEPHHSEPDKSADELYQQARGRWAEIVDIGVYDDRKAIYTVTPILAKALRQDPSHVKSLALLSDLLMEVGAYEEASAMVARLRELEPGAPRHEEKAALLQKPPSKERRNEIQSYLAMKWQYTEDW